MHWLAVTICSGWDRARGTSHWAARRSGPHVETCFMRIIRRRRSHAEWQCRRKHGHKHIPWNLWGNGKDTRHECVVAMAVLAERATSTVSIICMDEYHLNVKRGHTHCNNLDRSLFFGPVGG